jgi:EAL domain-containing protein (putative c-di-GMP-specific phosphodiesterase class I)
MVERHGITTDRVRLEVTEGSLLDNPQQARQMLETLRDAGLAALLDDFGTGYSSLSYLHQFPIHALKIDRSFVAGLNSTRTGGSHAVVEAVLSLAQSLGVEVIAEGIETTEQREALLALGCTQGQGYLFGRPRPLEKG